MSNQPVSLDKSSLQTAAKRLAKHDDEMRRALEIGGPPKLWKRTANFATLVRIILEQQVSLASAWNTYRRLESICDKHRVTPLAVDTLGVDRLKEIGFSRQKARYATVLADNCLSGRFKIRPLVSAPDDEVRDAVVSQLGMGDWTADMFLMLALCRTDIFPIGDLAIVNGLAELSGGDRVTGDELLRRAESWRPYRSVAARLIWGYYLNQRGTKLPS